MVIHAGPAATGPSVFDVSVNDGANSRRFEQAKKTAYSLSFLLHWVEGGEQKRPFGSKIGHGRVLPKQVDSTKKTPVIL